METRIKQSDGKIILRKYSIIVLLTLTCLLICYYVISRAIPMLLVSEENYGTYYYPRAIWLFPHIVLGIIATVIGPFQFIPKLRNSRLKLHKKLGQVYVVCVILSGMSGMYLATTSDVNLAYSVGLFGLGFTWSISAIMAYVSVKNKKIELHKDWMIRSYVITLAFVTFRLGEDILAALEIGSREDVLVLMSWASWAVPLFIAEVFIQGSKIKSNS